MYDVIVIGAGLAGVLTAIELSKKYKVCLLEAGEEIIPVSCTSFNECYKLHTGMHYLGDKETAEHCLLKAIEFGKRFSHCIKDFQNPNAPWRRGRHYIMTNSQVSVDSARDLAHHLQQLYKQYVDENSDNAIFGSPEEFIKVIDRHHCPTADSIPFYDKNGQLTQAQVALAIETGESQIDITALKASLQALISENKNINFIPNTKVLSLQHNLSSLGYTVKSVDKQGKPSSFQAKSIIAAAWQNNELITKELTKFKPNETRVNRIKVSIQVKLPPCLHHLNTCIFSSGPFASITLLGNGSAILTSERHTNIGFYLSGSSEVPEHLRDKINRLTLDNPEGKAFAHRILSDCASYFSPSIQKEFLKAVIEDIHIGYVKLIHLNQSYTDHAIFEKDSVIHSRRFDGVEHLDIGLVMNSGMKMTYTAANARRTAEIIDDDFALMARCEDIATHAKALISPDNNKALQPALNQLIYTSLKSDLTELAVKLNQGKTTLNLAACSIKQKIEQSYCKPSYSSSSRCLMFSTVKKEELRVLSSTKPNSL